MRIWEALIGTKWVTLSSTELLQLIGEPKLKAYRRAGQASLELKPIRQTEAA